MFENTDNFYFSECRASDQLLIIFSGAGAKSFNCFKLLEDFPINKLFIRDATRSWYQHPVKGHWDNINGMIDLIRYHANRFDARNITCMGGSMGGYAAMVTAAKLRAGKALLFSPQTVLDCRLPNNPAQKISITYRDAFKLILDSSDTSIKIYAGTEDLADLYNLAPALRYRGIDLEFIYGGPHNLMNFLFQRNMLLELVSSYLENRDPRIIYPSFMISERPALYRDVCDFVKGFYFSSSDFKELDHLLNGLIIQSSDWPALYHYKGKLNAKFGDHSEALKQFQKTIEMNDQDDAIFSDLGLSAIQTGDYKLAEFAFRKADEISLTPSPMYLSKLGAALMLQKKYDDAVEMQHRALEVNSEHAASYYQLGLIKNITENYQEAIPLFERAIELGDKNPNAVKHLMTARNKVDAEAEVS